MNQKIKEVDIVENKIWEIGRYTIVQVKDSSGIRAVGLSRKSQSDKHYNKELALKIANGRALKSLSLKKSKKNLFNHPLMG